MSLSIFMDEALKEEQPSVLGLYQQNTPLSQRTPALNKKLASELASVRAVAEPGKSYFDLHEESLAAVESAEDPRELFNPYVQQFKDTQLETVKASAIQRIRNGEDPNVVLQHLALTKTLFDSNNNWDANLLIKGVQTAVPFNVYEEMNRSADARPFGMLRDKVAAEGREGADWEDVADFASLFFVPDNIIQDYDVLNTVNKSGIMTAGSLTELGNKYKSLTPIEKEMFWESVFPVFWDEYDGNDLKISMAVARLQGFDPKAEQQFSAAIDAITVVGAIADARLLYSGAKALLGSGKMSILSAKRTQNSIKNLRDAGQEGAAADAVLAHAATAETQEQKLSAAMNASPYNFEGTVLDNAELVDGLAADISNRMQKHMEGVSTLEGLAEASKRAALEQKSAELDIWAENELANLGGRSVKQIEAELAALKERRAGELASSRGSTNPVVQQNKLDEAARRKGAAGDEARAAQASVADLDAQIARLEKMLDQAEGAKLGKQFSSSMKAGRVPEEFSDDIREAQAAIMREWEAAPVDDVWKAEQAVKAAQDAEVRKISEELGLELKANPAMSSESLAALKVRAAKVNSALNIARKEQRSEDVARLEKEAADIRKQFDAHQKAKTLENELRAVQSGKLSDEQAARVQAAAPKLEAAKPSATNAASAATKAVEAGAKYSENKKIDKAITEGVSVIENELRGYKTGEAFIDVARTQFARNQIERASAEYSASNRTLKNAEVTAINEDGLTIKYTLENGEETKEYRWSVDSLGEWSVEMDRDVGMLLQQAASNVLSPQAMFKGLNRDMVSNMTLGGLQASSVYNNLTRIAKNIFKETGLNKEQIKNVENLLLEGDIKGEVYTPEALLYTNNVLGKKYSPEEVMAYFQWRAMYDNLADIQNAAVRRALHFQGWRELHIAKAAGNPVTTMVRKATQEELDTVGTRKIVGQDVKAVNERVFVLSDNSEEVVKMEATQIQKAMDEDGYELHKLYWHDVDGTRVQWALIKQGERASIRRLRTQVLHKVTGYIPRVYKPGRFFVKDENFKTVGGFDGRKEAEAWIDSKGKKGIWQALDDKALPPESIELDRMQSMGGLWFMPRRGDVVRNPITEKAMDKLDLGAATQQYLNNVAELLPLNEYRHGLVRQFQRAVQTVAEKNGRKGFSDIADPLNARIETGNKSADEVLDAARKYIVHQISAQTTEESRFSALMGAAVDIMEGKKGLATARNFVRWSRHQDVVSRAKAGVFHAYLGTFNFAQLFVQAQNATVAMSVYPKYALPAVYDAMKMRAAYFMDKEAIDLLSSRSGIDMSDVAGHMAAMKRSGYLDSIYRQDAFQSQLQGFGGSTLEAARRVLRSGAIPFEEGELFARLVAFNIAKREHTARTGAKVLTDLDLHAIIQNSLRINLNMQKENAALWQSNWMTAIPTQFLQVQAKFVEQVGGGLTTGAKNAVRRAKGQAVDDAARTRHTGLTAGEASRVALGQIAMYGVVGVPLADQMMKYFAKAHGYVTAGGEPDVQSFYVEQPDLAEAYSQGAMGYGMKVLGFNTNVSERFSIVAGLDDNVVVSLADMIIHQGDPVNASKMDLGDLAPGVGVVTRSKDVVSKVSDNIRAAVATPETTPDQLWAATKHLSTVASSFSNYEKLSLFRARGAQYSRAANRMIEWDPETMNYQTQLAKALGFSTEDEHVMWEASDELKDLDAKKNMTKYLIRQSFLATLDENSALAGVYMNDAAAVLNHPVEFKILQHDVFKQFYNGESMDERVRGKTFQEFLHGFDINTNLSESYN